MDEHVLSEMARRDLLEIGEYSYDAVRILHEHMDFHRHL